MAAATWEFVSCGIFRRPPRGVARRTAPWSGGAGHDDLARDLGIDHICHSGDADRPKAESVADLPDDTDDQYVDDGDFADDGGFEDDTYDA